MNIDSAFELLRRGRPLAASLAPLQAGRLAWVGVYPLDLTKPSTGAVLRRFGVALMYQHQPVFRVRVIEVSEPLVNSDHYIGEEDLYSRDDGVVIGEEALMRKLDHLGVPRGALELPYKVNYPI